MCLTIPARKTTASFLRSLRQEATKGRESICSLRHAVHHNSIAITNQSFIMIVIQYTMLLTEYSIQRCFKRGPGGLVEALWKRDVLQPAGIELYGLVVDLSQHLIEIGICV